MLDTHATWSSATSKENEQKIIVSWVAASNCCEIFFFVLYFLLYDCKSTRLDKVWQCVRKINKI